MSNGLKRNIHKTEWGFPCLVKPWTSGCKLEQLDLSWHVKRRGFDPDHIIFTIEKHSPPDLRQSCFLISCLNNEKHCESACSRKERRKQLRVTRNGAPHLGTLEPHLGKTPSDAHAVLYLSTSPPPTPGCTQGRGSAVSPTLSALRPPQARGWHCSVAESAPALQQTSALSFSSFI